MLLCVPNLWGTAAIPEGTSSVGSWAKGTTASCSAQGFLYQFGYYVIPSSYYVALSFYSFTAVRNNFQLEKSTNGLSHGSTWWAFVYLSHRLGDFLVDD
jgi:hypothetical protein